MREADHSPLEVRMTVARNDYRMDRVSSLAICEEIGDRLRQILAQTTRRLPKHMINLVKRMATEKPSTLPLTPKPEVTP
jgi:hypothetical protein